jgi:5-methylcytosine-specific restriction endonuclease McrA
VARKPNVPCARCGTLMWGGTTSLPPGKRVCQPCRRVQRVPYGFRLAPVPVSLPCLGCGEEFAPKRAAGGSWTKSCSRSCAATWKGHGRKGARDPKRVESDRRRQRYERELAAPGLSIAERDVLRLRWVRQGRGCFYCASRPATTLDHVIPLNRGGTNYEGNLVPACRSCNSSKRDWLLIEWRTARVTRGASPRGHGLILSLGHSG